MISWHKKLPMGVKVTVAVLAVLAIIVYMGIMLLDSAFGMTDDVGKSALSPDHRYKATLHYKDGIAIGFQHVILETTGRHPFGIGVVDIVEVDESGLEGVSWRDNHTLVIDYDATKHRNPMWDTDFVSQEHKWRDVRIEYHKTFGPDTSSAPTTK